MRTFDLNSLNRFAVGFDHMQRQMERMMHADDNATAFPPYDIEVLGEDDYVITMAIAGFKDKDLDITQEGAELIVHGKINREDDRERTYLHKGIAQRAFTRRFQLADHVNVTSADLSDGVLTITLKREVPEALKPRKVAISKSETPSQQPQLEDKAA